MQTGARLLDQSDYIIQTKFSPFDSLSASDRTNIYLLRVLLVALAG